MHLNEIPDAFADQVVSGPSEESSRANIRLNDLVPSVYQKHSIDGILEQHPQCCANWNRFGAPRRNRALSLASDHPRPQGISSIGVGLISHD